MRSYKCCETDSKEVRNIASLSNLLKIASEESRLRIICLLNSESHCVCEITEHTKQSQSLVSHHLTDLKKAGLATDSRNGRRIEYALTEKGKKIANMLFNI